MRSCILLTAGCFLAGAICQTPDCTEAPTQASALVQIQRSLKHTLQKVRCKREEPYVNFGSGGFQTGRHGSRLALLGIGLELARRRGLCHLQINDRQKLEVQDMLNITDNVLDLGAWIKTCANQGRKQSLHTDCENVSVKWMSNYENIGGAESDDLNHIRSGMLTVLEPFKPTCSLADADVMRDDHLVVHMRSGDVWQLTEHGTPRWPRHLQPPCSFYQDAFQSGLDNDRFKSATIVTSHDANNPCIQFMLQKWPNAIRVQSGSLREDACTLMSARNLAMSTSMFPAFLLHLNKGVQRVFAPFADSASLAVDSTWRLYGWTNTAMTYAQHLYTFPSFGRAWQQNGSKTIFTEYASEKMQYRFVDKRPSV